MAERHYFATLHKDPSTTLRITSELDLDGFLINNKLQMGLFDPVPGLWNVEQTLLSHSEGGGFAGILLAIEYEDLT